MALRFFNKVHVVILRETCTCSMICIGCHVGGHTLASNMAAKTTFCLYLVECLIVTLRCAVNVTTSSFQHFPLIFSATFLLRKR